MQTLKTSKARESILGKIRNGLNKQKMPMPFPEAEREAAKDIYTHPEMAPEELFASEFIKLGGKFVFCENTAELVRNIHALYDNRKWNEILCTENELTQRFEAADMGFVKSANPGIEAADACITGCEQLISRTGSMLFSSRQNLGRIAPVFYPVHIVVAYPHQLVTDIRESIDRLKSKYGRDIPSMINLNTGPSRTADIEKTLVVGVHGPKEVFCFYVNQ